MSKRIWQEIEMIGEIFALTIDEAARHILAVDF